MKDPRYPYALDLGSEVGGYRIDAVLGAGGFGITYRAVNDVTAKVVAIKEFYVRDISTRTGSTVIVDTALEEGTYEFALGKFMEEAQTVVARFSHPNIIKGENFLQANNTSYLVMDYVAGLALEDWLIARQDPPSEAELRWIFDQLFDAVDYIHDNNTMHRDLTPRNIMIRTDGHPVLIDFGAAGQGIDRGRSSRMVAQMRYAPPEQTDDQGPGIHGRYTDIFSLGGVLYRAISGKPPMSPMTRIVRMGRKGGGGIDPHVPAAEAALRPDLYTPVFLSGIDAALQLDERDRPQSIDAFRAALGWQVRAVGAAPVFDAAVFARQQAPARLFPGRRVVTATAPLPETVMVGGASAVLRRPLLDEPANDRPAWTWGLVAGTGLLGVGFVSWPLLQDLVAPPPRVSPYDLEVAVAPARVVLSGHVPSDAERARLLERARVDLPGRTLDARLRLGSGAPPNYPEIADFGLSLASFLAEGQATIADDRLTITGFIRSLEQLRAFKSARDAPPPRMTLARADVGPRRDVVTQECDRLAADPDHPDRPADVAGVPETGIDGAAALLACAKARAVFPNVRRFATWSGRAQQSVGDRAEARRAYELAIEADDPRAPTYLADMRLAAIETLAEPETRRGELEAIATLYARGAESGDVAAMLALARIYETGAGRPPDAVRALAILDSAIAAGSWRARWNAAVLLDSGRLPASDLAHAARLIVEAATAREPAAVIALAGDMSAFSPELRMELKRRLGETAGFTGMMDGEWDAAARQAAARLGR